MTSARKRIVFTGGSGKAGRHVIPKLLSYGYQILNLDLVDFDFSTTVGDSGADPAAAKNVFTLKTDLTDLGQVYAALTTHYNFEDYENGYPEGPPQAVIHFAAYARNMIVPDNETFRANVMSTYNVIEAASKLGVPKIIIASSETTYGVCFSEGRTDFHSFPLEEDKYDVDPMDSYALSKICGEKTARTFSRRYKNDIYALRIGNVIEPHEYARDFPSHVSRPETRRRNAWSYIDARDLGQICHLCIEKSGLGFQVFNATNNSITTTVPTVQFLKQEEPNSPITRDMDEFEAPLTNRKIRDVLGFKEEHDWRKYYNPSSSS